MNPFNLKFIKFKPLWDSLSPRRRRQLFGLQILSLAAAAGEVANLGALLPFLNLLANPKEGLKSLGMLSLPFQDIPNQHLLLGLGIAFFAVVVLSTSLRVLTVSAQLRLTALIAADLGKQVFSSVLYRPFSWHLENNSSKVLGYLTKDVDQANTTIQAFLNMVVNFAIILFLGISLVALSPKLMLIISSLLAIFYLVVFRYTRGRLRVDGERLTSNYQKSLQIAQEGLGGIRDVLLDRSQSFFLQNYKVYNRNYRLAISSANTKAQVPRYLIEGFAVVLIVALSLTLALNGQSIEQQLPLLGTLALGAYRLLQPLQQCFAALSSIQSTRASLIRLQPFMQRNNHSNHSDSYVPKQLFDSNSYAPLVEIRKLSFQYSEDSPYVLRDLDFAIQPGERIAFVGSTGSGKSTISDLILGLLKPTEGELFVHGHNLHQSANVVDNWQERVAHVPQNIFLSDGSFAENIAFGVPSDQIDYQRVSQAALQARIADLIEDNPYGYDGKVGERGVKLSGGQRQRIGLARALYKKAELLVLDEATSALDNRTEAEVMDAINSLNRNITVVLIAHRLSTVQNCDRILHLEKGMISGLGSYDDLLENNSTFQLLVRNRATHNM